MSTGDVGECLFNAVFKVIWWWFWYGVMTAILGSMWGFLLVLVLSFTFEIIKKATSTKQAEPYNHV